MNFLLTFPVRLESGIAYSQIQIGHMEYPESLVLSMCDWSVLDFIKHWRNEIGALINGARNKCCAIHGLCRHESGCVFPTGWWLFYMVDGKIRVHEQLGMSDVNAYDWTVPSEWWKNISDYYSEDEHGNRFSEWVVSLDNLEKWCSICDNLFRIMDTIENDPDIVEWHKNTL